MPGIRKVCTKRNHDVILPRIAKRKRRTSRAPTFNTSILHDILHLPPPPPSRSVERAFLLPSESQFTFVTETSSRQSAITARQGTKSLSTTNHSLVIHCKPLDCTISDLEGSVYHDAFVVRHALPIIIQTISLGGRTLVAYLLITLANSSHVDSCETGFGSQLYNRRRSASR